MDYNPHSPQNIGFEWVPVLQADFSPDNLTEYGYIMRLDHSATVVSGGIGINSLPPQMMVNVSEGVNIYPQTSAYSMGPVRMVTIPVQSGAITGSNILLLDSASIQAALASPTDDQFILFTAATDSSIDNIGLQFGVTAFANELSGKRIVKVRLIYVATSDLSDGLPAVNTLISRKANKNEQFTYQLGLDGIASNDAPQAISNQYDYVDLGDWNPTWGPGLSDYAGDTIFPWRYQELANLDAAAIINVRQQIMLTANLSSIASAPSVFLAYMALQVFYCEETRVAYGGRRAIAGPSGDSSIGIGEMRVPIRDTSFAAGKVLTPGNYVVTTTNRPVSNFFSGNLPPTYAAVRQFNPEDMSPVDGTTITPTSVVNDTYTNEETDVIVDISLYTAVAAVTGAHSYANQIQAPIYGSINATQDVHVRPEISSATTYTQVRFYARRFGNTTIPLRVTLGSSIAAISVDDFDLLDEIVDGWKEVTLTLSPTLSLTGDAVQTAVWSAFGELASNQWQVLGAQTFTTSPVNNVATYDPPGGGTTELTWKGPNQTSATVDAQADGTIILAQSLPAPTSFVLTTGFQAVTGVAQECGLPAACIPTGIGYVGLTWDAPIGCDHYDRVVSSGWGTMTNGKAWTVASFTGTSSVDGTRGIISHSAVNDYFGATINLGTPNQRVEATFAPTAAAATSGLTTGVVARYTDSSNYYMGQVSYETTGSTSLVLLKRVAGVATILGSLTITNYSSTGTTLFRVELQAVGSWLYLKGWDINTTEPDSWQIVIQDTSLTTGNLAGVRTRLESGSTNTLPLIFYVDDFYASDVRYVDSTLQIQRQDSLDGTDWQTIVDARNACFLSMNDYEARVGMASSYRARFCDALDFCGPWVTGAATLASPGVTGSGANIGESVLIFTSNRQPLSNLVYPMVWNQQPIELFAFPEADTQVFQRMYGRDFQVAFRPLERGGEVFERTLLVQAAAIPVPSLGNFHSLRDLAWADLPYVCVRDELGNRWYANVLVPAGQVNRGRRFYIAQVRVTEVADTAAPVTS